MSAPASEVSWGRALDAADLISVKLGINVVNADAMRLRAFISAVHGFLDTIRDGHPTTPLLLVSPIYCGIHENTPGPGMFDPESFSTGQVDASEHPLPDALHPDTATHELIGRRFAQHVFRPDGPFAAV